MGSRNTQHEDTEFCKNRHGGQEPRVILGDWSLTCGWDSAVGAETTANGALGKGSAWPSVLWLVESLPAQTPISKGKDCLNLHASQNHEPAVCTGLLRMSGCTHSFLGSLSFTYPQQSSRCAAVLELVSFSPFPKTVFAHQLLPASTRQPALS